jgi:hypothetical protein
LTLAQIDRHAEAIQEIDVAGILAFAERVLPRRRNGTIFQVLARGASADEKLVSPLGVEPRTNRLRVCCSAN